ncbi:MAG: 4Fe-4S dicluster domain-containing protein [Acidobacteria bacterium]|nr:4Fe-4S dicluster domain-containing protein [Acidobacteriota bacterium]
MITENNNSFLRIEREDLQGLIEALAESGYRVIGPTVRDGAIVYDEVEKLDDLPAGWTDEQQPGSYRLKRRDDRALFGFNVGPHSWKKFLHPPNLRLFQAKRNDKGFEISNDNQPAPDLVFLGVRACELHAIAIQDKVFINGPYVDSVYGERREKAFVVAVNCGQAGGTCFCTSMKTGPRAESGFDIALTEVIETDQHYFVAEAGSERGVEILEKTRTRKADESEKKKAVEIVEFAASRMGRNLDTTGIKELLYRNHDHPRWEDVASRCLTCANCTMACPTCFCTTVEDTTDLTGDHAERWRRWDSCFTTDFSYIHGGSMRVSVKSRYRQWMTHKLAAWIDQFGTSGCVGCGRCITWCPAGIDITEEAAAIRKNELQRENKEQQDGNA